MKLIGSHSSPFVRKVRMVLAEKKIDYDMEDARPWAADSSVSQFNPLGKVPVLVLEDGRCLYDSRVIVEFLDNVSPVNKLIPAANRERSEVRRWEALADGVLEAGVLLRMEGQRPEAQRSPEWMRRQQAKIEAGLAALDRDLGEKPWYAGIDFTLADIAVGACLGWLAFRHPHIDIRGRHSNLARLLEKLAAVPSFAETQPRD